MTIPCIQLACSFKLQMELSNESSKLLWLDCFFFGIKQWKSYQFGSGSHIFNAEVQQETFMTG